MMMMKTKETSESTRPGIVGVGVTISAVTVRVTGNVIDNA